VRIAGLDPGLSGAAALIEVREGLPPRFIDVIDMPTMGEATQREVDDLELIAWLKASVVDYAYLERSGAMPGQGVSSTFRFGFAAGQIRTCLRGCKIPFTLVAPTSWKAFYYLRGKDKEASRQLAVRCFPDAHESLRRIRDHNRGEALLIARWGALVDGPQAKRQDHRQGALPLLRPGPAAA
jgi:crossover junction endodeoxyribonuclease RuvC